MFAIRKTFQFGYLVNNLKLNFIGCNGLKLGTNGNGKRPQVRRYSAKDGQLPSEQMQIILRNKFPKAKTIAVNDISGGCGSMFEIFVETVEFKGLPLVKQHRIINETLKDQIKNMHGMTVRTKIPDDEGS